MSHYVAHAGGPLSKAHFAMKNGLSVGPDFKVVEFIDRRTGKVVGATAYEHFTKGSCEMHVWVEDRQALWSRWALREVFAYPFLQINLEAIYTFIPANHEASLRIQSAFGFKEKYRIVDGFERGVDLVFSELRKSDCRWIREGRKAA